MSNAFIFTIFNQIKPNLLIESFFSLKLVLLVCYSQSPANIYLFKGNKRNTGNRCEICSKLTIKTPVTVSVEHISHLFIVFLLLALDK